MFAKLNGTIVSLCIRRVRKMSSGVHPSLIDAINKIGKPRPSPSTATLHVLGCGARGLPKSVYFFTENSRYLFNCGEGTQRLAHEYKLKLSRLEQVFVTSTTWDSMGGLPGMSLTLQDIGVPNITLHGPPGLEDLFVATHKFVVLNKIRISTADCKSDFEDSSLTIKYVPIESSRKSSKQKETDVSNEYNVEADDTDYYSNDLTGRKHIKDIEMKKLLVSPRREQRSVMNYICRIKPRLGTLDLKKCVEKGVKPGPILGLLKNGEDVTLEDGTVVKANEVRTPDSPGPIFIVMDIPDESFLDNLLKTKQFKVHQDVSESDSEKIPSLIVHFTPDDIVKTEKYQTFMERFSSSTHHLMVNESNNCFGSMAVERIQNQLNLLSPEVFPLLPKCPENINQNTKDNVLNAKTMTYYSLRPDINIDRTVEIELNTKEYIKEAFKQSQFNEELNKFHEIVKNIQSSQCDDVFPKIVFFGTGSCIPNKTRNTSSIMIHIDENHLVLLDCGEGTFGQIAKYYGRNNISKVLEKLKAIYVSHLHADHHIGLVNLLLQRKKALESMNSDKSEENHLYLFAPKQIMPWLYVYDRCFEEILTQFRLVPNSKLVKSHERDQDMNGILADIRANLNVSNIETAGVKHCPNAFAVSITANNKKITYSGDTLPCATLVDLATDSNILIHEATMEDELADEAMRKYHSTTSQAMDVARRANAENTILTHFSQRYARVPRLSEEIEELCRHQRVGLAFDNMEVSYKNLGILPYMYPTLKTLFSEHYEMLETRAAKRAMKKDRDENFKSKKKTNVNNKGITVENN